MLKSNKAINKAIGIYKGAKSGFAKQVPVPKATTDINQRIGHMYRQGQMTSSRAVSSGMGGRNFDTINKPTVNPISLVRSIDSNGVH